jgi:hypothetical protein
MSNQSSTSIDAPVANDLAIAEETAAHRRFLTQSTDMALSALVTVVNQVPALSL